MPSAATLTSLLLPAAFWSTVLTRKGTGQATASWSRSRMQLTLLPSSMDTPTRSSGYSIRVVAIGSSTNVPCRPRVFSSKTVDQDVCGMDIRLTRDSEAGGDDLCSWCVDSSRIRVLRVSNPRSGFCRSMKKCGGSSKLEARYHQRTS